MKDAIKIITILLTSLTLLFLIERAVLKRHPPNINVLKAGMDIVDIKKVMKGSPDKVIGLHDAKNDEIVSLCLIYEYSAGNEIKVYLDSRNRLLNVFSP